MRWMQAWSACVDRHSATACRARAESGRWDNNAFVVRAGSRFRGAQCCALPQAGAAEFFLLSQTFIYTPASVLPVSCLDVLVTPFVCCHFSDGRLPPCSFRCPPFASEVSPPVAHLLTLYSQSKQSDLQQRCLEFLQLAREGPAAMAAVLPVDASCEDVEVRVLFCVCCVHVCVRRWVGVGRANNIPES